MRSSPITAAQQSNGGRVKYPLVVHAPAVERFRPRCASGVWPPECRDHKHRSLAENPASQNVLPTQSFSWRNRKQQIWIALEGRRPIPTTTNNDGQQQPTTVLSHLEFPHAFA
jgi:hypothetical protein